MPDLATELGKLISLIVVAVLATVYLLSRLGRIDTAIAKLDAQYEALRSLLCELKKDSNWGHEHGRERSS